MTDIPQFSKFEMVLAQVPRAAMARAIDRLEKQCLEDIAELAEDDNESYIRLLSILCYVDRYRAQLPKLRDIDDLTGPPKVDLPEFKL